MWVFGYGSLMWDGWEQNYHCLGSAKATLRGYTRAFNKLSVRNWGTKNIPGPTLNLRREDNAVCVGKAFQFANGASVQILSYLKAREGKGFKFPDVDVELENGSFATAVVAVYEGANTIGTDDIGALASMVARAMGEKGSCVSYVEGISRKLAEQNVHDAAVTALLDSLRNLQAGT